VSLTPAAAAAGLEALRSGWLTMGPRTEALEEELVDRFGVAHAVATSSGTAALHLSCIAVGAGTGTQVLAPALAPRSCHGAPSAAGAEVVPYDVDGIDPDPERVLAADSGSRPVRAVIARHPLGFPADLDGLATACSDLGAPLIEDCREALGASKADGAPVGGAGEVALLSFASGRQVPAGEGGAVLTDSAEIAARVRSLRSHAMTSGTWDRHRGHAETYDVVDVGFNYRIDEIRAAMVRAGLADVERTVANRRGRAGEVIEAAREAGALLPAGLAPDRASPLGVPLLAAEPTGAAELQAGLRERLAGAEVVSPQALPGSSADAIELAARLLVAWL
jgi:dTDP-4-amino-4,6-dideoxygalactose transaminase